jgi:hypothetical protein
VITYSQPVAGRVYIEIFDVRGRRVASVLNAHSAAGQRSAGWNGRDERGDPVTSGVYVCRVRFENGPSILRKLIKM